MSTSTQNELFEIRFWGTRGTLPTPGPQFARAGGNTNCTEITCGSHTIVIDAGTGIRELGSKLISSCENQHIHLLLTHAHYDHVEGIPFFAPFFSHGDKLDVYSGPLDGSSGTEETVKNLMRRPYFPVSPDVFTADVTYNDVVPGEVFHFAENLKVSTAPLNHPGGATAYRIDFNGRSFACITDTEHTPGKPDENVLGLIENVDIFTYDCSLTDEELPDFAGYGHSTYEEGIRLAKLAKAGAVRAVHHMPFRTDQELDRIEKSMQADEYDFAMARENDIVKL